MPRSHNWPREHGDKKLLWDFPDCLVLSFEPSLSSLWKVQPTHVIDGWLPIMSSSAPAMGRAVSFPMMSVLSLDNFLKWPELNTSIVIIHFKRSSWQFVERHVIFLRVKSSSSSKEHFLLSRVKGQEIELGIHKWMVFLPLLRMFEAGSPPRLKILTPTS